MRRALATGVVALAVLVPTAAGVTLTGKVSGGTLPAPAAGVTSVRAVDLRTQEIAGTADVARRGGWSLRALPAGTYSVVTAVVRRRGRVTQAISPAVRVRKAGRVGVRTSLRRRKVPPPRRLHAGTTPVVQVRALAGSGPNAQMGRGLAEMLITELGDGDAKCPIRQKEGIREDLIIQELALQNSGLIDPSTRIVPRPITATLEVRGSVTTTADSITWSIRLIDAATGTTVGGDEGTARGADGILGEAPAQIAARLLDQICGARYDVALSIRTDARFASHIASGTISAVVTATGARTPRGSPPARFSASGALGYDNLSFIPTQECGLSGPVSEPGSWNVVLEVTPAGRLRVTWDPEAGGTVVKGTATITCPTDPPVPVPGFPGPSLVNPAPLTFELPVDGGQQDVSGGIQSGAQGWTHSGTITIHRLPR